MEKFNTSEKMSHFLRFVSARLGSIFCAIRKSIVERKKAPIPPAVKEVTREQQKDVLLAAIQAPIDQHNRQQENKICGRVKEHVDK
jgi:hypothetical protein